MTILLPSADWHCLAQARCESLEPLLHASPVGRSWTGRRAVGSAIQGGVRRVWSQDLIRQSVNRTMFGRVWSVSFSAHCHWAIGAEVWFPWCQHASARGVFCWLAGMAHASLWLCCHGPPLGLPCLQLHIVGRLPPAQDTAVSWVEYRRLVKSRSSSPGSQTVSAVIVEHRSWGVSYCRCAPEASWKTGRHWEARVLVLPLLFGQFLVDFSGSLGGLKKGVQNRCDPVEHAMHRAHPLRHVQRKGPQCRPGVGFGHRLAIGRSSGPIGSLVGEAASVSEICWTSTSLSGLIVIDSLSV